MNQHVLLLLAVQCSALACAADAQEKVVDGEQTVADTLNKPEISVWYGDQQRVGQIGHTNPQVNLLGSIKPAAAVADMSYRINGGRRRPLILGPDLHRLARSGDFNVEIERDALTPGKNVVQIHCRTLHGVDLDREVVLEYQPKTSWPMPYEVNFAELDSIQDAVEIVDGKWQLTKHGVRTAEPYYDRTLAFGDASWTDFELEAEIIFHRHFVDFQRRNPDGPPYLSHAHTSFNLRWGGYPDDGWVPRRDWQSIGSLVALRCDLAQPKAGSYWWMHFGRAVSGKPAQRSVMTRDVRYDIQLETPYRYRMRVETISDHQSRYRTKVWRSGEQQPTHWQMEAVDESESIRSGCVVFVVHHSDVTLCKVKADRLGDGSDR